MINADILIIAVLWFISMIYLEYAHLKERRDLYDRLMSKDFTEFKAFEKSVPTKGRNFLAKALKKHAEGS